MDPSSCTLPPLPRAPALLLSFPAAAPPDEPLPPAAPCAAPASAAAAAADASCPEDPLVPLSRTLLLLPVVPGAAAPLLACGSASPDGRWLSRRR